MSYTKAMIKHKRDGFTIVELLIVIVIIAILAAITIVAYNGIQNKARNSIREQDMKVIAKALELYYVDNGYYPSIDTYTLGSTAINSAWSTTADGSWSNLAQILKPYASQLPTPPGTSSTLPAIDGGNSYDYFGVITPYCGTTSPGQGYLLVYHTDGAQKNTFQGGCASDEIGPYVNGSNIRVIR